MFIKDLSVVWLLDFYGDVLPERTQSLMRLYYDDDLSLGEIAESEGISRQGVRHTLKKGEEELRFLEEKLGLARNFAAIHDAAEKLLAVAEKAESEDGSTSVKELAEAARECATLILQKE